MIYIFLGPSLPLKEAEQVLDAHYLPPAQLGDILTLVREKKPKIIALIDGYFSQTLPVWHKEILYALQQQVIVLGASSMGALRAAETDAFGMVGIGKIYEMYRSEELTDDDEVALVHGSAESAYFNLSLPMVNIRATLQEAVKKGLMSEEACQKWIKAAKDLYYPQRTVDEIILSAKEEGTLFRHLFESHYVDQKREDALALLNYIAAGKAQNRPVMTEPLHENSLFQQLFHQDRSVFIEEHKITLRDIAKYVALHHPSFSKLREEAFNRVLVKSLAKLFSMEAEPSEIEREKERFMLKCDLMFPAALALWLEENHLSQNEFEQLMADRAKAEKLYTSPLTASSSWRLHKALLEELKLNNQYTEWAKKAAAHQAAWQRAAPFYHQCEHPELFENEIFRDHIQNSEWDLEGSIKQWCEDAGFHHLQELALELHKSKLARNGS